MYLPTLRLSKQTENVMQFPSQPKWFKGRNGTSFHCEQQSQTNQKTWMNRNLLTLVPSAMQTWKTQSVKGNTGTLCSHSISRAELTKWWPAAAPPLPWGHWDTAAKRRMDLCTLPLETVFLFPWVSVPENIWNFLRSVDTSSKLQSVCSVCVPMQRTNSK